MAKRAEKEGVFNEAEQVAHLIDSVPMTEKAKEEIRNTLTPTIIQFLLRWETGRDLAIEERVIDIVMKKMQEVYVSDNERLCKDVADVVGKQLAEVLELWNRRLQGIEQALEGVAEWQKSVNELHVKMDKRIKDLEERVYKTDHERIQALERYASPSRTFFRILVAILVGVSIAVLITFFTMNKRMLSIEDRMHEYHKTESIK